MVPREVRVVKSSPVVLSLAALLAAAMAGAQPAAQDPAPGPRLPRLVLASYAPGYQGDGRRVGGPRAVRLAGGMTALTHHPWESDGPWFSGERPQWHRNQLQLMQGAGIDVALVPFRGGTVEQRAATRRSLGAMVEALTELRNGIGGPAARGRDYPQLAPAIDLRDLAPGGTIELRGTDAQRSLYGLIREFFLRVPEEFRAVAQLTGAAGGSEAPGWGASAPGAAAIVRLTGGEAIAGADAGSLGACSRHFAQEFGARLLWIGTPEMRGRLPGLDGYASALAAAGPARFEKGTLFTTASLGPGFENALAAGDGSARSRGNGSTYIADWRAVLDAQPEWVFLDSWNDFTRGTDLAPTLEYGLQYRDLTRGATMQFKATPASLQYAGSIVRSELPRVVQPGVLYPVEVVVKNDGSSDWDSFSQVSLSYRWFQEGKPVGDPSPAVALAQPRGEARAYAVGLAGPLRGGKPLTAGPYQVQLGLLRRTSAGEAWLEEAAVTPYRASVTVGQAPALRPCWLGSSLPAAAQSGATYPVTVRLRNDGSEAWRRDRGAAVGFRWRRVSSFVKGASDERDEVVAEGPKTALREDVAPGRAVALRVDVPLADSQGKALALPGTADPWSYVLEWDLWDGKDWASKGGAPGARTAVEGVERDPAPSFVGCNLPAELVAGRTERVTVGLRNLGPKAWKAGRDRVIVHWYYLDGTEAAWNDSGAPLAQDVPPFSETVIRIPAPRTPAPAKGGRPRVKVPAPPPVDREEVVVQDTILRDVPVQVPHYFGPMYCVFDLLHEGRPASTAPALKGTDILVVPVNVYSPDYLPVPLTPFFNTDGISSDLNRADGNIDGRGNSIPAEGLPPYVTRPSTGSGPSASPIYPCGLWSRALNAIGGDRITFLYPSKADRMANMVACSGQRLPLVAAPRVAAHVLALSTDENAAGEFRLVYGDTTVDTRRLNFSHYTDPPAGGEHAAFVVSHRHTQRGDDLQARCYLKHYVLSTDPGKPLIAIELPQNPAIKVVGITLESGSLASGRGGDR
jgi:hypothetical protein